jgi:hypothetical protein
MKKQDQPVSSAASPVVSMGRAGTRRKPKRIPKPIKTAGNTHGAGWAGR